jgi:enoyl-CoA hydratase
MNPTLQRTERDGILLLTLNRPEARNAMNFELATALAAAMDELDAREDLRLGIITAEGAAAFAEKRKPVWTGK